MRHLHLNIVTNSKEAAREAQELLDMAKRVGFEEGLKDGQAGVCPSDVLEDLEFEQDDMQMLCLIGFQKGYNRGYRQGIRTRTEARNVFTYTSFTVI